MLQRTPGSNSAKNTRKNYVGLTYLQAYYKEPAAHFNNSLIGVKFGSNFSENFGAELFAAGAINQANLYVGTTLISANWAVPGFKDTRGVVLRIGQQ